MKAKFTNYNLITKGILLLLIMFLSSCGSRKDLAYFQDEPLTEEMTLLNNYEIKFTYCNCCFLCILVYTKARVESCKCSGDVSHFLWYLWNDSLLSAQHRHCASRALHNASPFLYIFYLYFLLCFKNKPK